MTGKWMKMIRFIVMVAVFIVLLTACPETVTADMGPKPELKIKVIHPPEGVYYLDLLTQGRHTRRNIEDNSGYDPEKLSLLENYQEDGWAPALVQGTDAVPMWGKLTGEKTEDGMIHTFGYMGIPENFKIIIISPENQIIVSEPYHRETFRTELVYDYGTGEIKGESIPVAYTKQFFSTLIPTLIIEGILLFLFGFPIRKNVLPFGIINIITQAFLTFTLGSVYMKQGSFSAAILFLPVEFVIIIAEAALYCMFLTGQRNGRKVGYAIIANTLSACIGFAIIILMK